MPAEDARDARLLGFGLVFLLLIEAWCECLSFCICEVRDSGGHWQVLARVDVVMSTSSSRFPKLKDIGECLLMGSRSVEADRWLEPASLQAQTSRNSCGDFLEFEGWDSGGGSGVRGPFGLRSSGKLT